MSIEYRTTGAFQGDPRAQQLSFGEDEIIQVSESDSRKRKNGWGRGKLLSSNQCGWFLFQYVEPFMPSLVADVPVGEAPEIAIIEELHPLEVPVMIAEEEDSSVRSALSPGSWDLNGAEESDHGNKLLIEVRSSFQKAGSRISSAASMTGSRISSAASTAGSSISSIASAKSATSSNIPVMARKDCLEGKVNPAAVRESFRKVGAGLSTAARQKRERISCVASKTGSMISQAATSTGSFLSHGLQTAAARNNWSDGSNEGGTEHQPQQQLPATKTKTTASSTTAGAGWFRIGGQQTATPVTTTTNTTTTETPPPVAPSRMQQVIGSVGTFAPFKTAADRSHGNIRQPTKSGAVAGATGIAVEGHDEMI